MPVHLHGGGGEGEIKISFEGTAVFANLLKLLRDIYQHPETTETLQTYILLRMKQIMVRDKDLDKWLKSRD